MKGERTALLDEDTGRQYARSLSAGARNKNPSSILQYGTSATSAGQANVPASPPSLINSLRKKRHLIGESIDPAEGAGREGPLFVPLAQRGTLMEYVQEFWEGGSKQVPRKSSVGDHDDAATEEADNSSAAERTKAFLYYIVYAIVNCIISVPGLYGYAAVIFSHDVFLPHMNALSKLVIFSSLMHQLSFCIFSSLPFAIGTVQDAGLIFLSSMSSRLANEMLAEGSKNEEIMSTVLVLLALGTATLGLVLIAMGQFRLADAVSYLPMPVVGGYLAFIGYFCLEAGIGLAISEPMTTLKDWVYVLNLEAVLLATPALLSGLVLTWLSRYSTNDAALPLAMVAIPALFYVVISITGAGLEGAREGGWVGDVSPSVPVGDLFRLVDFSLVRWDLIGLIVPTWLGMVLVVAFASSLDVAAISMDMGEALETNKELKTVGIGNLLSGLTFGFTGSYIFSQTIFTYRTGSHSRWIGFFIMIVFAYVVVSPVNILQVAPLFFLGSTLIFIGYDLLYEWLFEIREKVFLTEYIIVWCTFIAIQIVGMDGGIVIGVLVAIVDHVVHSSRTTGIFKVNKRSRAVWSPEEHKILQSQAYNLENPKIVTIEVAGFVFFGSSLGMLQRIMDEVGLELSQQDEAQLTPFMKSPHTPAFLMMKDRAPTMSLRPGKRAARKRSLPKYLALDLTRLHNLDASASRGCFLQLVKMCAKRGITVVACGASVRVEWMLRSHDVAYSVEEELRIKERSPDEPIPEDSERLLLFLTIHEALAFCERGLIRIMGKHNASLVRDRFSPRFPSENAEGLLAFVFSRILGSSPIEEKTLRKLNGKRYHEEIEYTSGQEVFPSNIHSDAFYVVLKGSCAVAIDPKDPRYDEKSHNHILSGAGIVRSGSRSNLLYPAVQGADPESPLVFASVWPVGGVFGYVDCLLQRQRNFRAVATESGTLVAKITMAQLQRVQNEDPVLDGLIQRVLLQASLLDLANCTCDE